LLKHSIKRKKAVLFAFFIKEELLGFSIVIPYRDLVLVEYLAISEQARGDPGKVRESKDRIDD